MSLKSRQDPHTKRLTVAPSDTDLIWGRYSSTTLAMASRDSESDLSPVYLHRHSRQTRSKDMDPLARGTPSDMIVEVRAKVAELGANAVAVAAKAAKSGSFIGVVGAWIL